jgi:hypothetical protein
MNTQLTHLTHGLALASIFVASRLSAQTILDNVNDSLANEDPASQFKTGQRAPMLFEDELKDVGPQFLLIPGTPAHDWFRALLDFQWFNTTNPTLAEDGNRRSADLMVGTAQFGILTPGKSIVQGTVDLHAGYRYQYFEYGELTGDDMLINGQAVRNSDFRAHTVFADGRWSSNDWHLITGARYTELNNNTGGHNFYNEFVLSWGVSKDFYFGQNALVTLGYDGSVYNTVSETGAAFLRDDFNDRVSHAVSARLVYRVNSKLYLQPYLRVNYADYEEDLNGERRDVTSSMGASLSYYFMPNTSVRLFVKYQTRDSNGAGISDYSSVDTGVGGSISFKF